MSGPTTPEQLRKAIDTITTAFKEDGLGIGDLAYTWFYIIKMPIYDEIIRTNPHAANKASSNAANHLMYDLFNITTNFE